MAAAWRTFLFLLVLGIAPADAQEPGTLNPEPLPPLHDPNSPQTPAITGSSWQVMRVSRNPYWGNPILVGFIERLADAGKKSRMEGLLIGDMSQPRGGPTLYGHSSHQMGLDVDITVAGGARIQHGIEYGCEGSPGR
jgi:penicillin-insensitive murein endopeptidase